MRSVLTDGLLILVAAGQALNCLSECLSHSLGSSRVWEYSGIGQADGIIKSEIGVC